jgi:hypothetical protein
VYRYHSALGTSAQSGRSSSSSSWGRFVIAVPPQPSDEEEGEEEFSSRPLPAQLVDFAHSSRSSWGRSPPAWHPILCPLPLGGLRKPSPYTYHPLTCCYNSGTRGQHQRGYAEATFL